MPRSSAHTLGICLFEFTAQRANLTSVRGILHLGLNEFSFQEVDTLLQGLLVGVAAKLRHCDTERERADEEE